MKTLLALPLLLLLAQDKENPQFKYWSAWKPGAWTKSKMEMDQAGQKMEMELTAKLLEVGDEKLVIESSGIMKMAGKEYPSPARKQDIKLKDPTTSPIEKEGDEEVEVAGKKMAAHWLQFTQEQQGKKMTVRIWLAKDVPGGAVKTEMVVEGATTPMMKMVAVAWGEK